MIVLTILFLTAIPMIPFIIWFERTLDKKEPTGIYWKPYDETD